MKQNSKIEQALIEQLLTAGGRMGPFAMHTFENGVRGCIALEDIPKGSLIVHVPES